MGRKPCCDRLDGLRKGLWTIEEDQKLTNFILNNGIHCWRLVPKLAGVMRCGKSCRLRWMNYLRPGLKKEPISEEEAALIIQLHSSLGNKWSKIAAEIPGRTDNEIKNLWNKMKKKLGLDDDLHGVEPHDQDQTHKQLPADDGKEMEDEDHVEYSKSLEAEQVVELSSINTGSSRAGSKVDDDISKTNRENIDRRSSSSSASSYGSSNTTIHENNANNIPQVDHHFHHQDHSFSPEMDESFSDKDFHYWLESAVVSCDGID